MLCFQLMLLPPSGETHFRFYSYFTSSFSHVTSQLTPFIREILSLNTESSNWLCRNWLAKNDYNAYSSFNCCQWRQGIWYGFINTEHIFLLIKNYIKSKCWLQVNGYRCICCPCHSQHCMYRRLRNTIHRCSRVNTVCWHTRISFPLCLTRAEEVCYWNILIPTLPVSLISCSIQAELLLTSSRFHVANVSGRQIQTAMANKKNLGTPYHQMDPGSLVRAQG